VSGRYLVLLSSGLDSTINLYAACKSGAEVKAVTFDYGQVAANAEIRQSRILCDKLKVPHEVIELPMMKPWKSGLSKSSPDIPKGSEVKIYDIPQSTKSAARVWVPNRNGIFLSVAAGLLETMGGGSIVPGFNAEEAKTFPDNSVEFVSAMNACLNYSTRGNVKVECFTLTMDKKQIAQWGKNLNVCFEDIWPCYEDGQKPCGLCESCQRFLAAM
jgi:7-cyano-7-deazaguanine synthase